MEMTLQEIVEQLESCGYQCEAGPLENNVAFVELKRMANAPVEEQRWQSAIEHARQYLGYYLAVGPTGILGATMIQHDICLYEDGERTPELLAALEGIE